MDGYWQPFSASDCELLSKIYESGIGSTVLYIGANVTGYVINTEANYQLNANTSFRRRIQMLPNSSFQKSGAAGVTSAVDNLVNAAVPLADPDDDCCAICLDPFDAEYGEALALPLCGGHGFHKECIKGALQASGKCPLCQKMYIIPEGLQPSTGTMSTHIVPPGKRPLAGYETVGTIIM